MNRPIDTTMIKNLMIANGMDKKHWCDIENFINNTRQIHHSILFFIIDPYIAIQLLPQYWYDMFPVGFIDFVIKIGNTINHGDRIALFRLAMHFDINDGICMLVSDEIHIDTFLSHIPECFLDVILNDKSVLNKLIDRCKIYKQDDSMGYAKLLLLK